MGQDRGALCVALSLLSLYSKRTVSIKVVYGSGAKIPKVSKYGLIHTLCVRAKFLQLCLTLFDPINCSLPGSSVHQILQSRILEWVATPSSRGPSRPRDRTPISYVSCIWHAGSLPLSHQGSPFNTLPNI